MGIAFIHQKIKIILVVFGLSYYSVQAQSNSFQPDLLKPDPAKEAMYLPYLAVRHGGMALIEEWKSKNTYKYYQELWYYTESFYVKRNYLAEGLSLDESIIDVSRFESERKASEEAIVVLPGFKDVLVLIPGNKLIYQPQH